MWLSLELSRLTWELTGETLSELAGTLVGPATSDSASGPRYWGREEAECVGERAEGEGDFLCVALRSRICFSLFANVDVEAWTLVVDVSVALKGTTDIKGCVWVVLGRVCAGRF